MKQRKAWLAFLMSIAIVPSSIAHSITGTWLTFDEATGKKRSVVRIEETQGVLNGTLVKVYPQPGDTGVCSKCPGHFKNKSVLDLQFIWGLNDQGNGVWDGGKILDPKTGKIYRSKMTLVENKLHVRGYIGISMLGRTQIWERINEE